MKSIQTPRTVLWGCHHSAVSESTKVHLLQSYTMQGKSTCFRELPKLARWNHLPPRQPRRWSNLVDPCVANDGFFSAQLFTSIYSHIYFKNLSCYPTPSTLIKILNFPLRYARDVYSSFLWEESGYGLLFTLTVLLYIEQRLTPLDNIIFLVVFFFFGTTH